MSCKNNGFYSLSQKKYILFLYYIDLKALYMVLNRTKYTFKLKFRSKYIFGEINRNTKIYF